jgi:hypothetical protein
MAAYTDHTPPGKSKPINNALEVLQNCVYLIGVRGDAASKQLAEYMTAALEVVTAYIREGLK